MNNLFISILNTINNLNDSTYFTFFMQSILGIIISYIIFKISEIINDKFSKDNKNKFLRKKIFKKIVSFLCFIYVLIIWKNELKDLLTFISLISAALTLSLKEIIYNYFCGIYIKFVKPIKIEDRIKVDDTIGDVININSLSYEILEVLEDTHQSTGKIIHIPNSSIFNSKITNYNICFKYIWDELKISIDINNDINKTKDILNNILKKNKTIIETPNKMKKEIENDNGDYRIYYNKFDPIIYTEINDNKLVLTLRFLVHPKKQRNVESELYENIINEFKKNDVIF